MSSKIEILCPNGHRVYIKTTQFTTILQLLEDACQKQGFLPFVNYELRSSMKRTPLDLSLTVEFAGLSNNAKLELVMCAEPRKDNQEIKVALQSMDGVRLRDTKNFCNSETIWDIVDKWQFEGYKKIRNLLSPGVNTHTVVVIYMRREIIGEYCLKNTTLHDIGLNSGAVMLRIVHREVDPQKLEVIENELKAKITAKCKAHTIKLSDLSISMVSDSSATTVSKEPVSVSSTATSENMEVDFSQYPSNHYVDMSQRESQTKPTPSTSSATSSSANRVQPPTIVLSNPIATRPARPVAPEPMDITEEEMPDFSNFKFPEETKGQDLYHNEKSVVSMEELKPCDRKKVVYEMESKDSEDLGKDDQLDDDYFKITESDLMVLYRDAQRKLLNQENVPLQTKFMRDREVEKKMDKYVYSTLRIQFPDRTILQGVFRPRETIHALHKFVKEHLANRNIKFHLYTSPPKVKLCDLTQTLLSAKLVPMAMIYFGSDDCAIENFLKEIELEAKVTKQQATQILEESMPKKVSTTSSTLPSTSQGTSSGGSNTSTKVPKWFKTGRK